MPHGSFGVAFTEVLFGDNSCMWVLPFALWPFPSYSHVYGVAPGLPLGKEDGEVLFHARFTLIH